MIGWLKLAARLNQKSAECLRLQRQASALQDDLADALSRFGAAIRREQEAISRLAEAQEELRLEREKAAAYAKMARRPRPATRFWHGDDIDEMLRDAEGDL